MTIEKQAGEVVELMMHFNSRLDTHIAELYQAIHTNDEKSTERHAKTGQQILELTQSVKVLADRRIHNAPCDQLQQAIPKADWKAHCDGHIEEELRKTENAELLKKIKLELFKYATIGIFVFLCSIIWGDFLRRVAAAVLVG